jgi:ABC-type ATPase involved in cell division
MSSYPLYSRALIGTKEILILIHELNRTCATVLLAIEKISLMSSQPQNNFTEKSGLIGNLVSHSEVWLGGVRPS